MTNTQFQKRMEQLALLVVMMLRDCDCDKSKIDDVLWTRLCEIHKRLEEQV